MERQIYLRSFDHIGATFQLGTINLTTGLVLFASENCVACRADREQRAYSAEIIIKYSLIRLSLIKG